MGGRYTNVPSGITTNKFSGCVRNLRHNNEVKIVELLLNYKQGYNIMNKIITLSIATIFLATSYASHSQNIEHQSPHHKIHWF
jgi:hypothetical protein